jgi:hypothetical protein
VTPVSDLPVDDQAPSLQTFRWVDRKLSFEGK